MIHLMTNKQILRKNITDKFRSLSYFCKLTEISYKKTLALFVEEDDSESFKHIQELYDNTDVDVQHGLIRDEDRKAIRMCILTNFKNLSAFHRENPRYNTVYLSNIIRFLTVRYDLDVMIWYRIKNVSKIQT